MELQKSERETGFERTEVLMGELVEQCAEPIIKSLYAAPQEIAVEGIVSEVYSRTIERRGTGVLEFDLTDMTGTIRVIKYVREEKDMALLDQIQKGDRLRVHGTLADLLYDEQARVLEVMDINRLNIKGANLMKTEEKNVPKEALEDLLETTEKEFYSEMETGEDLDVELLIEYQAFLKDLYSVLATGEKEARERVSAVWSKGLDLWLEADEEIARVFTEALNPQEPENMQQEDVTDLDEKSKAALIRWLRAGLSGDDDAMLRAGYWFKNYGESPNNDQIACLLFSSIDALIARYETAKYYLCYKNNLHVSKYISTDDWERDFNRGISLLKEVISSDKGGRAATMADMLLTKLQSNNMKADMISVGNDERNISVT